MSEIVSRVEIRHLRVFIALARRLNFSRVADDLYLNQSAVSRTIAELERDVNSKLFERDHRQVQLTPAGASMLGTAETIVQEFDGWIERARQTGRGIVGQLHLGAFGSSFRNNRFTADVLQAFCRDHPEARVEFEEMFSAEVPAALRARRIDVGFGREQYDGRDLVCRTLLFEPLIALVAPNHRLASRRNLSVSDLQSERVVTFARTATHSISNRLHDVSAYLSIPLDVEAVSNQLHSLYHMAAFEGAVAVVAQSSAPARENLAVIPFDDPAMAVPLVMVYLDEPLSPLAADFVGRLVPQAPNVVRT